MNTNTLSPLLAAALLLASAHPAAAQRPGRYNCEKLITDAELQTATGLASEALIVQKFGSDNGEPAESTSCRYSGNSSGISVGFTVATGSAVPLYSAAVFSGPAGGREKLAGIGDEAVYIAQGHAGGARTHGVVIVVRFQVTRPDAWTGFDVKAAVTKILKQVVGRV
jgi:hypothetical protein